jgi:hypothetical protein
MRSKSILLVTLAALALTACNTGGTRVGSASGAPVTATEWAARPAVRESIALLNAGEALKARNLLVKSLKKEPANFVARKLVDQIDKDPRQLLGAESFPYIVQQGDTLTALAEKHLGDPTLFYALARYNNINPPSASLTGRLLRIPGKAPEPPTLVEEAKPAPAPRKSAPTAKKPPAIATPAKKPAPPAAPPANPTRAAQLRAQGLASMNGGNINRAVALLRQAQASDPANAAIKNDLARALRIQSSLRK